jgi:nucleoside-diphosphate-sugar epimerase
MDKLRIAILGSTSHIAKGLIHNFLKIGESSLHLYTKSYDRLLNFLASIKKYPDSDCFIWNGYSNFADLSFDIIINCVGVGTPDKLDGKFYNWFAVTEEYDNLVLMHLCNNCPDAIYISLSSGAVYGRDFSAPVNEDSVNRVRVNHVTSEDYYGIARLNAEAKHRAFSELNIIDLRIFSYFSRFMDLTDSYFITEVLNSILNDRTLITNSHNIVRDYLHPDDLFTAITKCIKAGKMNAAFDVNSASPVGKMEILDYFSREYGLKYEVSQGFGSASGTGVKNIYCSDNKKIFSVGYKPGFSSIEGIKHEAKYILSR